MNTTPNSKPDAEQYARVVLWHLCNIQQSLSVLESDMIRRDCEARGASPADILRATKAHGVQNRKVVEVLYSNVLKAANIAPSSTYPLSGSPSA
jgi:hypothetical protein